MKGLWHHLAPFATDTNGAMSVFSSSPALVVALDSNGSVSTLRRVIDVAAFETIDLPEADYITGDDASFTERIGELFAGFESSWHGQREEVSPFIVLVNGPVSSLLGIDLKRWAAKVSKTFGRRVVAVDTTGNKYYDKGIAAAYKRIIGVAGDVARPDCPHDGGTVLAGLNHLDWCDGAVLEPLYSLLRKQGAPVICDMGYSDSIGAWEKIPAATQAIAMSVSGIETARSLALQHSIAMVRVDELDCWDVWARGLRAAGAGKTLIVGEQLRSNLLRRLFGLMGVKDVTVATFFTLDRGCAQPGDLKIDGESGLKETVKAGEYQTVIGDAALARYAGDATFTALMHAPVGFGARDGSELSRGWLERFARAVGDGGDLAVKTRSGMRDFSI